MPALYTNAEVRYEHKVKIDVIAGVVVVTDVDGEHQSLGEGDSYTAPNHGGVTVKCVDSARIAVEDAPEVKKPKAKVVRTKKKDAK